MATEISILDSDTVKKIETPPLFSGSDRKKYFRITSQIREHISSLKGAENQIGYLIQFGYFKSSNRFYQKNKFYKSDIECVAKALKYKTAEIDMGKYNPQIQSKHR